LVTGAEKLFNQSSSLLISRPVVMLPATPPMPAVIEAA
jgi:hypothetical protein